MNKIDFSNPKLSVLKVKNSQAAEVFQLSKDKYSTINIYLCGPTVYSDLHIGNFRGPVIFDLFVRYARFLGYKVNYIQNITDIDDKIIKKAQAEKVSEELISKRYFEEYISVLNSLNINEPDEFLFVTKNMNSIFDFIIKLKDKGFLYQGEINSKDNQIKEWLFDTNKFEKEFISQKIFHNNFPLEEINLTKKKSNRDFVIWKNIPKVKGKTWIHPILGEGRPGWHTECCVLIDQKFGNELTIHGGGTDLTFPHHFNEMLQFLAINPDSINLAKLWMRHGLLHFQEEKISKSNPKTSNQFLAKNLLKKYHPNILKLLFYLEKFYKTVNLNQNNFKMVTKLNHKIQNKIQNLRVIFLIYKWKTKFNFDQNKIKITNDNIKEFLKNDKLNDSLFLNIKEALSWELKTDFFENLSNGFDINLSKISHLQIFQFPILDINNLVIYSNLDNYLKKGFNIDVDLILKKINNKKQNINSEIKRNTFKQIKNSENSIEILYYVFFFYLKIVTYILGLEYNFDEIDEKSEDAKLIFSWSQELENQNYQKADQLRKELYKKNILFKEREKK